MARRTKKTGLTRAQRNKALTKLALVVEKIYGPRCIMNEAGCMCCTAWAVFDAMDRLTDSDCLDSE